jgi:hypothetical protein
MKRIRMLGLCLAVMFAINVVGVASASAEPKPFWIKETEKIEKVEPGKGTLNKFFISVKKSHVSILCSGLDGSVSIGAKWASHVKMEFTKCEFFFDGNAKPNECEVQEPIVVNMAGQLVFSKKGKATINDILYPEGGVFFGSDFVNVMVKAPCETVKKKKAVSLAGEYKIEGSAVAMLTLPVGVNRLSQEVFSSLKAKPGKWEREETGVEELAGELKFVPPAGSGLKEEKAALEISLVLELAPQAQFGTSLP